VPEALADPLLQAPALARLLGGPPAGLVPVAGGHGVFREVAEAILRAQGHWDAVVGSY